MTPKSHYIPRKLSWTDEDMETRSICEDALLTKFQCPLVILGDPGMGKTRMERRLKERLSKRSDFLVNSDSR